MLSCSDCCLLLCLVHVIHSDARLVASNSSPSDMICRFRDVREGSAALEACTGSDVQLTQCALDHCKICVQVGTAAPFHALPCWHISRWDGLWHISADCTCSAVFAPALRHMDVCCTICTPAMSFKVECMLSCVPLIVRQAVVLDWCPVYPRLAARVH